MFYIMKIIVQPFKRGFSMQPDWNQPKKMLSPAAQVCSLSNKRMADSHLFAVWASCILCQLDKTAADYVSHYGKIYKKNMFDISVEVNKGCKVNFILWLYTQTPTTFYYTLYQKSWNYYCL